MDQPFRKYELNLFEDVGYGVIAKGSSIDFNLEL